MHTRERGSVNTFLFLIVLVLMLAALFFGYSQMTQAQTAQAAARAASGKLAQAKLDLVVRDHLIEDIAKIVGEVGTYKGRDGFDYSADIEDAQRAGAAVESIPELSNVTLPSSVRAKVSEVARDIGIAASLTDGLGPFLGQVQSAFRVKTEENKGLATQVANAVKERGALEQAVEDVKRDLGRQLAASNDSHTQLRQFVESEMADKQRRIEAIRAENQQRRSELSEAEEKHKQAQLGWSKEKGLLQAQNASLADKIKLRNAPEQPDGQVLSASPATDLGYIDLGRNDMLAVGTRFRVSDPLTGKIKAMAEVTEVDTNRAQVRFSDIADRFDFVVSGDKVSSPIYSPGDRRNVVLLGTFGYPHSREFVTAALEKLNNKVFEGVRPGVDLVVLGDEILNEDGDAFVKVETTEDYKLAQELGVEFAPLRKIRDFLKQ